MTPGGGGELRLFLDRSTNSKRFAEAVRAHVADVVTIGERYGVRPAERIEDRQWLAEATAEGRICVGADKMILSNELEISAVLEHRARYVVFTGSLPGCTGLQAGEEWVLGSEPRSGGASFGRSGVSRCQWLSVG